MKLVIALVTLLTLVNVRVREARMIRTLASRGDQAYRPRRRKVREETP
jgi:hypothetical protein